MTNGQGKWQDNWKSWEQNETSEDSYLGTSPKLKSLQDLRIRVNPNVTKEVMHHADLWGDGGLHLRLHVCKVMHSSLESSDPFYRVLSLVNPITDVPLQCTIPVRVSKRELEPRWDGPDEIACFTPLNNFFIPHNTCNNNTQQEVTSTIGDSISVSRMGGRKQRVV
jgi:hypothetical protein